VSEANEQNNQADRNLALELVRVTEAAAIAGGNWVGAGDKNSADGAAVDAMRNMLSTVHFNGTVVIGEGEKDEAPMLFNGEQLGDGDGPALDVAVDTARRSAGRCAEHDNFEGEDLCVGSERTEQPG